jgi:hypothetical protein
MTYSYTQISQYLGCPRRYKHRYLVGWIEKDTRAAMLFGRAFEQAVDAYFQRQDAAAVLYREWATHRGSGLHYSDRDSWDRMLQSGVQLLDRFAQDDRIRIRQPRRNLQIKFTKSLGGQNDFVAYVDAIGELDGTRCLLEWKTTASPAIRRSQMGCWPWIRSWSAIPGSLALPTWLRWCLSASGWSRSSTSGPSSARNNAKNSADWFRTRSKGLNPPTFCLTAASAFPRTPVPAVPTSVSVWDGRIWLTPRWCGAQGADDLGWLDELTY